MKSALIVCIAHLLVIALVCLHVPNKRQVTRKQIRVNTYVQNEQKKPKYLKLDEPISLIVEKEKEEAPKREAPKREAPKPTPKPSNKKPASKKAPQKTVKKSVKANPEQQKLMSMVQESLQTLNASGQASEKSSSKTQGKAIGKLASEALTFSSHYEDELVSYLESLLILPEKGSVKLKLTLAREGSVEEIVIVNATSDRNRSYVESSLASRHFPPFGSQFKGEKAHTFTITLTSENSR